MLRLVLLLIEIIATLWLRVQVVLSRARCPKLLMTYEEMANSA